MPESFSLFNQSISLLELSALLTGIAGVWLTLKQNPLCFPVGIINVTLYAWLFFSPGIRLYADALLQCIYIFLLAYGWITWTKRREVVKTVSRINKVNLLKLSSITLFSTLMLGIFFSRTNASLPWLDSSLTCVSLAAQWMIAKKYIDNWILWIVVDIIYIPMYLYKDLPLTALLYFIFLVLAIRGYGEWKKHLAHE